MVSNQIKREHSYVHQEVWLLFPLKQVKPSIVLSYELKSSTVGTRTGHLRAYATERMLGFLFEFCHSRKL